MKLLLVNFIITVQCYGQPLKPISKTDSSFTLFKKISSDKLNAENNGMIFYTTNRRRLPTKEVLKDFKTIEKQDINFSNYDMHIIADSNHFAKIWIANNAVPKIYKVIELQSTYYVDTFERRGLRITDTIICTFYLIKTKESPKTISYKSIDRLGVVRYGLDNKTVWVALEDTLKELITINESADAYFQKNIYYKY